MDEKQKARRESRAKIQSDSKSSPTASREQSRRLSSADEIKRAIDPATFYRHEIPGAPDFKPKASGWTQNGPCPSPAHEDVNGSFGVNLKTGAFRCHGCDLNGGGVIDFVMLRHGLTFDQARAYLIDQYRLTPGAAPANPIHRPAKPAPVAPKPTTAYLVPIPPDALASRPQRFARLGAPSATWEYCDAGGRPVAFVHRFEVKDKEGNPGKTYRPQHYTEAGGWKWADPPGAWPLYHLDRLATRPAAPVLFTEGEKASDAGALLLPDMVATTTAHGAKSPARSDFSPLAGRRVLIWPDHDKAGTEYAREIAGLALAAGAVSVEVLDLNRLKLDPKTKQRRDLLIGADAADALADGWTAESIAKAARWLPFTAAEQTEPAPAEAPPPAPPPEGEPLPYGFELRTGGLYYLKPGGSKGGGDESPPVYVCPPIRVKAVTRNVDGDEFGRLVEFRDLDGITRQEVLADRERQGSGDALRARLAALGFEVATTPESRRLFVDYLRRSVPVARARTQTHAGWTPGGDAFVLSGGRVIGGGGSEPVVLALDGEPAAVAVRGTLGGWCEGAGAKCVGNSRLLLAVSMSFAAPLLYWAAEESGGFHLLGKSTDASSSGKTTTMRVAASVCGDPYRYIRSWRTTDNATESIAEAHNDLPLFLDEMSQSEAKTVGDTAYMLGNGAGKTRMDRNAGGRPAKTWRVEYLSTGESSLAAHMATANRKVTAGQEVRMIEIPADAGAGYGVFEDLHGYANGADFAAALLASAWEHYGAPLIAWLEAIQRQRDALPGAIQRHRDAFTADALAGIADPPGQVRRVANRFGLLAVAGELATMEGLTGWPAGRRMMRRGAVSVIG